MFGPFLRFASPLHLGRRSRTLIAVWAGLGSLVSASRSQDVVEKWNRRYDGTTDGIHEGRAVAIDSSGNVVVTGRSVSGNGFDFYTVKYRAADGAELWSDRYDGTGDADDAAVAVAIDPAGNVIVTGGSTGPSSGLDVYTRKYDGMTGGDMWNQRDDGPARGDDAATALALDPDGNVVVAGASAGDGTGQDFYVAKYAAATGSRLWSRRYNGPANDTDAATAVAVDAAGDVLVTGMSRGGNGSFDWYTAKYNGANDTLLWDERRDGPGSGNDVARALALDAGGNAVVTGTESNNGNPDLMTIKYSAATGEEMWSQRQNGTGNGEDHATAIAIDASGDVVITGSSFNGRNDDLIVTKYAGSDGRELWSERYNGPGDGSDAGTAIAIDPQGNVIVTGTSEGTGNTQDFYTACHDGQSGRRLWFERFDGPRGRDEIAFPFGLALGPLNSVAITGATQMTDPPQPEFDFITILYVADLTDSDADGLPDAWEITHWNTIENHLPGDDSDQDGVVELFEYAFGLNPTSSDPYRLPQAVLENGYLTITLAKRPGVTILVESTGSLAQGSWSSGTTEILVNTAGTLKVRDSTPASAGQARFLRVQVTSP